MLDGHFIAWFQPSAILILVSRWTCLIDLVRDTNDELDRLRVFVLLGDKGSFIGHKGRFIGLVVKLI